MDSTTVRLQERSLLDFLIALHEREVEQIDIAIQVCMILWSIWMSRNEFIFQNKSILPSIVVQQDINLMHDFLNCNKPNTLHKPHGEIGALKWRPPPSGWLKMNKNAVVKGGKAAYDFVLRDTQGNLILSGVGPLPEISSVKYAELLGMWHGIHAVLSL